MIVASIHDVATDVTPIRQGNHTLTGARELLRLKAMEMQYAARGERLGAKAFLLSSMEQTNSRKRKGSR
jgi:hypothetical protein